MILRPQPFRCSGIIAAILLILFSTAVTRAQIRLPKLISNGMVLQRDKEIRLWGWASPKESIGLNFNGKEYNATADSTGNWRITLDPQPAGGPHEIVLRGKNEVIISDVLFGDVWLCSGQSNMELTMDRVKDKYAAIIPGSENLKIRQFVVPDQYDFKNVQADLEGGSWKALNQENILQFSAVGFFFAKDIYSKYHVPVGLINSALGGSPVEAWMSEEAIRHFPESFDEYKKFLDDNLIKEIEQKDQERSAQWYRELNQKDPGLMQAEKYYAAALDDKDWKEIAVPGFWADNGYQNVNGSLWYRKTVVVPESMLGKPVRFWLGRIVDQDSVFVNGKFVGTTGYQYPPRKYNVNADILKKGENVIAVRVINNSGKGGFVKDKPYFLAAGNDTVKLSGKWKYKEGAVMSAMAGSTTIRWKPVGLFNKMISPITNYRIKGALWYQGESNAEKPGNYTRALSTLINDWRDKWEQGDFPFLLVQLANFMESKPQPEESKWAELRFAQFKTLSVPNTGMVVTIDLGEWNDIHPLNKEDVGRRLALLATKVAYEEKDVVASGPNPVTAKFDKDKVIVEFDNAGTGLTIKRGKKLNQFAISADGKNFVWADGKIDGKKVIVSNKKVSNPTVIRYAWADNPQGALLYNAEGLPATPFEIRKESN